MRILYMSYDLAKAEWEKALATIFFARILICYSRVSIRVNWRFLFELKRPLESQRWSTVKDAGKMPNFILFFNNPLLLECFTQNWILSKAWGFHHWGESRAKVIPHSKYSSFLARFTYLKNLNWKMELIPILYYDNWVNVRRDQSSLPSKGFLSRSSREFGWQQFYFFMLSLQL